MEGRSSSETFARPDHQRLQQHRAQARPEFPHLGQNLVLVARNHVCLEALADEARAGYGASVRVLLKDPSIDSAASDIRNQPKAKEARVDVLGENAGLIVPGNFHENEWENEQQLIQANLLARTVRA